MFYVYCRVEIIVHLCYNKRNIDARINRQSQHLTLNTISSHRALHIYYLLIAQDAGTGLQLRLSVVLRSTLYTLDTSDRAWRWPPPPSSPPPSPARTPPASRSPPCSRSSPSRGWSPPSGPPRTGSPLWLPRCCSLTTSPLSRRCSTDIKY